MQKFWDEQPALLFALSLLIGTSSLLFWPLPWCALWPALWLLYLGWLKRWPLLVLTIAASLYGWSLSTKNPSGQWGYFSIASLQTQQTPFHKGLLYKGMLTLDGQQVPCQISYSGEEHPPASCDYVLQGKLQKRDSYNYVFKPKKWIAVDKTWSLAELRYRTKEQLRHFLQEKLTRPRTASFLSSLLTGDVEDRTLRYEFGRLGLQHILAISGFHFAILIAFCSFFLGLFLPEKMKILALLAAVNAYFLFVGSLPAVQRSWLTALLYLVGRLIHRHSSGLNLLGFSLLVEVLLDPLVSAHLGFQLSFLSCAGILLLNPLFEEQILYLLPKHRVEELSFRDRHVYLIASFLRKALSINLAVNVTIFPLLLYHFHKFPLLSLLYNLFFPLLVSAALFLLLLSLLIHFLFAPLAKPLFWLTDTFTAQILDLASYPPPVLDYSLKVPYFPSWVIPLYLCARFSLALWHRKRKALFFF